MRYHYITGTSRGIGKALAEELLASEENAVVGLSRHSSLNHPRYRHVALDLSDVLQVTRFEFPYHPDASQITLVNNAAAMTEIKYLGENDSGALVRDANVNLVSPMLLINNFLKAYRSAACEKVLLNVSSGVACNPIDGWAGYSAAKAGLVMLSRAAELEVKIRKPVYPVYVFSVGPGVIDTKMQDDIRGSDFSRVQDFIAYKDKGELQDVKTVAKKLAAVLQRAGEMKCCEFSLKEI